MSKSARLFKKEVPVDLYDSNENYVGKIKVKICVERWFCAVCRTEQVSIEVNGENQTSARDWIKRGETTIDACSDCSKTPGESFDKYLAERSIGKPTDNNPQP